ncbi:ABC transporter substrate-binding protein [Halobellus inordinatus]|uniref:ABC transporter substrate-binding protein n=1 Tax=Halobellus inordinatus TaxID=1126236 RepID=UPI00210E6333|nr:ABC transporter substrate-binding protein [Halobellus inordinatus]
MPSGSGSDGRGPTPIAGRSRRSFLQLLGLGGATAVAGCSAPDRNGAPTEDAEAIEYVEGTPTGTQTLNFLSVDDMPSANRIQLALDGAYAITPEQETFPLWADITSDEGRVYTVELRDNLRWGAGYGQMTAEDWVYMITEVYQADSNWAGYPNPGDWRQQGEPIPVEKTGPRSFEIRLQSVDPAFPLRPIMWGAFCMPKEIIARYRPDEDQDGLAQDEEVQTLAYAGNLGPYSFERWNRESEFVATRNEEYYLREVDDVPDEWQNAPYFDAYTYEVVPEESTRLSALRSGELTATDIPETRVEQFEGRDDVDVKVFPQAYMTSLIYNQRANGSFYEALRKPGVRRALAHAVDKRTLVDDVLRGYATVAHTFQPTFSRWYSDEQVTEYGVGDTYNHDRARELLREHFGSTPYRYDGDRVVDAEGEQLTLDLVFAQGSQTVETTAQYVAREYDAIGIDVNVTGKQYGTLVEHHLYNSWQGDGDPPWDAGPYNGGPRDQSLSQEPWDLILGITFNTYPRTPSSIQGFTLERGGINFYGYHPETDFASLFETATSTVDEAARRGTLAEIFGALSAEQPFNFLNMGVEVVGYDTAVAGPEEVFGYSWDQNTWRLGQQ